MTRRNKIEPIKITPIYLEILKENFYSENPKSVILTGTAGDGKTYYCREMWLEFGGEIEEWDNDQTIKKLVLNNGKSLYVVKDLSELAEGDREILLEMSQSVREEVSNSLYLFAANDGQLMEAWKYLEGNIEVKAFQSILEEMLVKDEREKEGINLQLFNLSRLNSSLLFPDIAKSVIEHPGWKDCQDCSYRDNKCPIWENRKRLEGENDNGLLRSRLNDLLTLCELNGIHLPIRQLLILVSNMILGHPKVKEQLMRCEDVPDIIDKNEISLASIYSNVFGENLTIRRRGKIDIFSTFERFGIGRESSNLIDNILIFGKDDPELNNFYSRLVLEDEVYGADNNFNEAQKHYLEGGLLEETDFLDKLRAQRQRLFFTIAEEEHATLDFWNLTTFEYAGEYLTDLYRNLQSGEKIKSSIMSRTIRGLNRILTGLLVQEQNKLILSTSGSHSQLRVSRIFEDQISIKKSKGEHVYLELNKRGIPELIVRISNNANVPKVHLDLQLFKFEFISRVAEGVLPGSFSRECYEDILAFKTKLLKQLDTRRFEEDEIDDEVTVVNFLRLNESGSIDPLEIEVNYNDR
jgi:hypothetical protein